MTQIQIDVRLQAAGKDKTFGRLLSEPASDALIAFLLRGDSEELTARFPAVADRIMFLYEKWIRAIHQQAIMKQLTKEYRPGDPWPDEP